MDQLERHREAIRGRLLRSGAVRAGPGSVFWKVHREWIVAAGWGRAILLQLAHPAVAAGVRDHSSFRGSLRASLGRARSTVSAMLAISFGDEEEMIGAAARINTIHDRVRGTTYSAHDPELQRWVHATLLDSNADVYRRLVAPLSDEELDRLCDESAPLVEALGGDPRATPRSWKDLQAYMTSMYSGGVLAVSGEARALGVAVLSPRAAGVPLPLSGMHRLIATGLLPPTLRAEYGFRWDAAREARFQRALATVRAVRQLAPRAIAYWPQAKGVPATAAPPRGR